MSKKRAILAAVVLALVLCIGGVLAYFSDSEKATNTFTVGKISIKLTEASWDENNAKKILPNQLIAKDPKLTNNGVNDAYVFMEVLIPTASIVIENQDGTSTGSATTQEMFTLINSSGAVGVNSEWEQVGTGSTAVTVDGKNYNKYIYSYSTSGTLTKLEAESSTVELFNKVRFANVQEGWGIEGKSYNVIVTGYAIQTENLNGSTTNPTPAQAWAVLSANAIHTGSGS